MKTNNDQPAIDKPLSKSTNQFPVVGIGASAGGLDAFKKLLKAIPEDSGMAFVLVQHLDPKHESLLPELLQKVTNIPVVEITDDIKVVPDHIYIIPSNKMMTANDGVLLLSPRPVKSKTERNLPIDIFFTSLAEVHQSHAIGVVLSGTASDGTNGLRAIKSYGGITFAQDEASAAYEGMPHSAAQAGVVDFILSPEKIPQKLLEITRQVNLSDDELQNIPLQEENVFKQILALLRLRKGTDFTYYKQTTIRRRILRRMVINKNEEPGGYLKYLRESKLEQDVLYQDLLIPVTDFFRDTKTFDNLCQSVFPLIVKNKTPGEPVRIWVAGCSTGEEVYSIAICFKELLSDNQRMQIFATDISEPGILKARAGIYTKNEIGGMTDERLQFFFTKVNDGFQVIKSVRDMCVFAVHNFLKDPPFGKMDFISCRNVLIYMEPYLQKKALTTFHYALNAKGLLLLGKSETTSSVSELFAIAAKTEKLFIRKDVPGRFMHITSQRSEQNFADMNLSPKSENIRTDFQKAADDILLGKYTPAGVVINEAMDIVHFRGSTGNYLEPSPGKASLNLLKMAKNGLGFELRNILHKAKKDNAPVIKGNISLQANGDLRHISIEAIPLHNIVEPHYLILFYEESSDSLRVGHQRSVISNKKTTNKIKNDDKDLRIQQLERELAQVREDMRSITEDQEAVNEELQSANEELLSGSEELQSLNEEMETSKEELQSTNEELMVVNQEMIGLNEQVSDARDYAEAIVTTIREPLLVLDKNLRVKSANSAFYKTFRVNEGETEGRLFYELGDKQWNIPELRTMLEEILPHKTKFADYEVTRNYQNLGERVMLLNAREITREKTEEKLILLAIEDVTEKVTATKKIEDSYQRYSTILMQSPFAFSIMKGKDMVITLANNLMKEIWGKGDDVEGKTLLQVLPELNDQPFPGMMDKVYTTGDPVYANEMLALLNHNGEMQERYFNIVYQPHLEADETISGVTTIAHEVTNQVLARKKIEESESFSRTILENSPDCVKLLDSEGRLEYINVNGQCLLDIEDFTPLKNKYWWELWDDANRQTVKEAVANARNGKKTRFQAFRPTYKGTPKWWDVIVAPIQPMEGFEKSSQILSVSRDITEQKQHELKEREALARFQTLVLQAPVAICVLRGKDYVIEIINDAMCQMWDRTLEEAIDIPLFDLLTELGDQGFKALLDHVYTTGERFVAEELAINLKRNGKLENAFVKFVYEPLREADGTISGVMALAHEITEQVVARKKMQVQADMVTDLLLTAPAFICTLTGPNHVYELVNERYQKLFGKRKIQGKPIMEALPELEGQGFDTLLDKVYTTGETYVGIEVPIILARDENLSPQLNYFNFSYQPMYDENKNIYSILVFGYEVTEQVIAKNKNLEDQYKHAKELEEKVRQRTMELSEVNDSLQKKNQEIAISKYNKRFLTEFSEKFSPYKLHNEFFNSLVQFISDTTRLDYVFVGKLEKNDQEEFTIQTMALSAFGKLTENINYPLPDGPCEQVISGRLYSYPKQCRQIFPKNKTIEAFQVEGYLGYPLNDEKGNAVGLIAVMHGKEIVDVETVSSILKIVARRTEIELERINHEGQLMRNNKILEEKNEELVEKNKELHAFTFVSSHDLQEPLRKIKTFAKLIAEKESNNLTDKGKDYFNRMVNAANRMQALLEDLLVYSQTNNNEKNLENTDIHKIVDEVIHELSEMIREKKGVIEVGNLCEAQIIPFQFRQLFNNLISNSLKFSIPGKPPHIIIKAEIDTADKFSDHVPASLDGGFSPQKKYCHISFIDNGIGFDEQYQERIFELFQRLHSKEEYPGTGIGLAIVKKIVDNHNGIITAKSALGKGAQFDIYIPVFNP